MGACVCFVCLCMYVYITVRIGMYICAHAFLCRFCKGIYMPVYTCRCMSMGKLVILVCAGLLICLYIFVHVSVYVYMYRPVNVCEYVCTL